MSNALLDNVDLWTGAVRSRSTAGRGSNRKIELVGVKKLRELILELAVRGKLVPQDASDEPASELLKRIEAEKAQLIAAGKIKKQKPLPPVSDDEKPFELPKGWEWVRLGDALEVINGRAYKKTEMLDKGVPLLRVGNLFTSNEWYYSDLELEPSKYIEKGDLIYAWSASFGPFIWNGDKVIYHYHIWKLSVFDEHATDKHFLFNYLRAITRSIKASGNGIAMLHMTKERMEKLVIPIPPAAEQHRIVAKVDELMQLCDQLEQHTDQQHAAHQQLVETLLNALTQASSAADLAQQWQRIAAHFDELFVGAMGEWAVDRLKDSILQLAVMGKLVPQDPADEPASELLKRIEAEKAQLIKDGKIKKQKPLPPVGEDEKPFELPKGWEWVRLAEVYDVRDGTHDTPKYQTVGYPLVTSKNLSSGKLDFSDIKYISEDDHKKISERSVVNRGDILFAMIGTIGNPVIVDTDIEFSIKNTALFKPFNSKLSNMELLCLQLITISEKLKESAAGGVQKFTSLGTLRGYVVPLPSLAEQHRIVAKVDQLFALCDQLKTRIQTANQLQLQLTDTLIEQTLA